MIEYHNAGWPTETDSSCGVKPAILHGISWKRDLSEVYLTRISENFAQIQSIPNELFEHPDSSDFGESRVQLACLG